jgi:hypothetical protein
MVVLIIITIIITTTIIKIIIIITKITTTKTIIITIVIIIVILLTAILIKLICYLSEEVERQCLRLPADIVFFSGLVQKLLTDPLQYLKGGKSIRN